MTFAPHDFWQDIYASEALSGSEAEGYLGHYAATLPDERRIALPLRVLPGDGTQGVASLIVNQASFAVLDALAAALAAKLAPHKPDVVIALPTLGLTLGDAVARKLGHSRMVPLGTSKKFWYEEALSVPMSSITSPDQEKRLYVDPRMLPLLQGRRVVLIDDVASSGRSVKAALAVLALAGITPVACGFAMAQGQLWRQAIPQGIAVESAIATPRLRLCEDGRWRTDPLA